MTREALDGQLQSCYTARAFLFCGVRFVVFMSLIFIVLFVCLFTVCSHVSLIAFWLPVFNKHELSWGQNVWRKRNVFRLRLNRVRELQHNIQHGLHLIMHWTVGLFWNPNPNASPFTR